MQIQEIANAVSIASLVGCVIILMRSINKLESSTSYTLYAQAKKITALEKDLKDALDAVTLISNNLRDFVIADRKFVEADIESLNKTLAKIQDINIKRQQYVDSQLEGMESEINQIHNLLGLNPMQVEFINQYPVQEMEETRES